jgi:CheY-like chemotaxis protein
MLASAPVADRIEHAVADLSVATKRASTVDGALAVLHSASPPAVQAVVIEAAQDAADLAQGLASPPGGGSFFPPALVLIEKDGTLSSPTLCAAILPAGFDRQTLLDAFYAARLLGRGGAADTAAAGDTQPAAVSARVLLAEDNPVNQKVTRRILEHAGHRVHVVGSGGEALDALEEMDFDAFVTDVNMVDMSGLDVVKVHRMASLDQPRLPVIVLTADATRETRTEAENAGVDLFLTKPVEPRHLLDGLARLVDAARNREDPAPQTIPTEPAEEMLRVTQISAHPRYRPEVAPAIRWSTVENLARFADMGFAHDMLIEYAENSEMLIARVAEAARTGDARAFRDTVHALRGTSGNVGAEAMGRVCQELQGMTAERLRQTGDESLSRLQHELARFRRELYHGAETLRPGIPG